MNTENCEIGRGVRQGCLLSPTLFSIFVERMMLEAINGLEEGISVGGELIRDVRFADDQAMLGSTERGLQKVMDRLNDTARKYMMKINIKKTKVMKISKKGGGKIDIYVNGERIEQVTKFKYLGAWLTEDGKCDVEIRSRLAMAKDAFNKRKELLSKRMNIDTKKRIAKALVWSVALYGAETWALRAEDIKRIEAFEMWVWRKMQKVRWSERKTNKEVLEMIDEQRSLMDRIIRSKKKWIGHIVRGDGLLKEVIEGRMVGKRPRGRKRIGFLNLIKKGTYGEMKRMAEDRNVWRSWMPELGPVARQNTN